jgi:predicted metal-dependent hydrolase
MSVLSLLQKPKIPSVARLDIAGGEIEVRVRENPRARHYRLTLNPRGEAILTIPKGGRWREAQSFLVRHRGWLEKRLDATASPIALVDGALLPVMGIEHRIVALDQSRGVVRAREGILGPEIMVPGGADHLARRLTDWLKKEARSDIETACAIHAANLGVSIAAIKLRDQATRWGSCSSARVLNFNWRLILAPPFVLDYVAAHEVAHIVEMNHSPAFWRTVERTLPEMAKGRSWLKANGQALLAVG